MAQDIPNEVDTVIIGNGPAALILSFVLHGNVPYYRGRHHDSLLHTKLERTSSLLELTPDLYGHFQSSLRYSTQALLINTLLDTLIRPNADTAVEAKSHVEWRHEPERAISHLALGNAEKSGGQWADNVASAGWDIGTLSYADMLSLPEYSFADHYKARHGKDLPEFIRPTRLEVADYFATYPHVVGIADAIRNGTQVENVSRAGGGFYIGSHNIRCKHLVLASGIFSVNIPPPPVLAPLTTICSLEEPLLVIGSGFSAADVIISSPPSRKIIHLFQWQPEENPSPLRGCHHQAYPEYAGVYRQMRLAAMASGAANGVKPTYVRKRSHHFLKARAWAKIYEGFPNATVTGVRMTGHGAIVTIQLESGATVERAVCGLQWVVGRRGRLEYLDDSLRHEVLSQGENSPVCTEDTQLISGRTLRAKAEWDLEVAPNVFIIGSLTGDSLIRHSFGGILYAAGRVMQVQPRSPRELSSPVSRCSSPSLRPNSVGHHDLHLDRRKLGEAAV